MTWGFSNLACTTKATYTVTDGGGAQLGTPVNISQYASTQTFPIGWTSLGYFSTTGTTLKVTVTNGSSGALVVDAVKIVPVSRTQYTYDANGNMLSTTDPNGHTSYTHYDALNRADYSVSALGSGPTDTHDRTTTHYDAVGNVTSVVDPDGNTTSYAYDQLNRQTQVTDGRFMATIPYSAGQILQVIHAPKR